jgi:hypothetical protein
MLKALDHLGRPVTLKCQKRNISAVAFYSAAAWVVTDSAHSDAEEYLVMEYTNAA